MRLFKYLFAMTRASECRVGGWDAPKMAVLALRTNCSPLD